ncbi:MAG: hypothetical protein U0231_04595 [Nitrospiraceae bacterium]
MTQPLVELVEQFCLYQFNSSGVGRKEGWEPSLGVGTISSVRAATDGAQGLRDGSHDGDHSRMMDDMAANDGSWHDAHLTGDIFQPLRVAGETGLCQSNPVAVDRSMHVVRAAEASAQCILHGCPD